MKDLSQLGKQLTEDERREKCQREIEQVLSKHGLLLVTQITLQPYPEPPKEEVK